MINQLLAILVSVAAQTPDTSRFAQGVEYTIEATLDEGTDVLHGRALLRYTNQAPTPLDTLWFHQHLNAFRPESQWARRDLEFGVRRFQDLGPEDHAYERLITAEVNGRTVVPVYPLSPDSTVVGLPLAEPLPTGQTVVVRMDWDARLSTLPRRQGRSGRHYDFAQWYPRIAAYDSDGWQVQPLLPQGEFYGEFGMYDVTLDVAEDQVIGATGVPVEGDPGWASAARDGSEILFQREFYADLETERLGFLATAVAEGRKRVRWRAEDVHHFAWSANPDFRYEGGGVARSDSGEPIAIHVLFWPTDEEWANGVAVQRTEAVLDWLQAMFGPYPWPQLTNLHRIEGGGTEFPMMMMNGSPSEGLIVHEGTHQYLHGILANNEWAEGWLDEGFTSFLASWFAEERGATNLWGGSMNSIRSFELAGRSQPIASPGAEFRDPETYSAMTYTKASLVLRMLRWLIGEEQMRSVLRALYDRHALSQVDEQDFRAVVSEVAGEDLDWFFDQWLHTTAQLDYAITSATTSQRAGGDWVTRVEVRREGDAWMPVTLRVGGVEQRLDSTDRVQTIEVVSTARPEGVALDPENVLIDLNPSNNTLRVAER
jgi:hypothetical protein